MNPGYGTVLERFEDIIVHREREHTSYNGAWLVEGSIVFVNGWRLEFMEFRSGSKHKYRFHLMDENEEMVTRWDTAPHFPDLGNAPFHRHTTDDVEPTEEHDGADLLKAACEQVLDEI